MKGVNNMYNYRIEMIDGTVFNLTTDKVLSENHSGLMEFEDGEFVNLDNAKHVSITKTIKWEDE